MAWEKASLDQLCEFKNGLWKGKKEPFLNVGVIRNTNFTKNGTLDDSDIAYLDVEEKQYKTRSLEFGDLILEKSGGGPKQPVGRVIPFDKTEGKFSFSNFTSIIRIKDKSLLDYSYLHRYLHYLYVSGATEPMQRQSTGIRNLQLNEYKLVEVPLPSIPEQKRIVRRLDRVVADIEEAYATTQKNLDNAKELFENYLQNVFCNAEDDWAETQLSKVANFKNGLNFSRSSKGESLKVVGVRDFKSNFWVPIEQLETVQIDGELDESYELQQGDIITVRSNGNKRLIGRCLLVDELEGKTSYSGFTIRIRLASKNIVPEFLTYYLKSGSVHELLIGSGDGANISNLNQKVLSSLPVKYPTLEIQNKLISKIKEVEAHCSLLIDVYSRKLQALDELKKSMLHKAFTGELTRSKGAAA